MALMLVKWHNVRDQVQRLTGLRETHPTACAKTQATWRVGLKPGCRHVRRVVHVDKLGIWQLVKSGSF